MTFALEAAGSPQEGRTFLATERWPSARCLATLLKKRDVWPAKKKKVKKRGKGTQSYQKKNVPTSFKSLQSLWGGRPPWLKGGGIKETKSRKRERPSLSILPKSIIRQGLRAAGGEAWVTGHGKNVVLRGSCLSHKQGGGLRHGGGVASTGGEGGLGTRPILGGKKKVSLKVFAEEKDAAGG